VLSSERGGRSDQTQKRIYQAELHLRKIDDLFESPDVSPMSDDYQVYSYTSGIEFVAKELAAHRQLRAVDLTLLLPATQIEPNLESRTRAAIQRYCASRIRDIENDLGALRYQSRHTLRIAIPAWLVLLGVGQVLSSSGQPEFDIAGQGLSVVAWILLWFPLDTMIFGIRQKRAESEIYRSLMAVTLKIVPVS
jgi:hypothetical protein